MTRDSGRVTGPAGGLRPLRVLGAVLVSLPAVAGLLILAALLAYMVGDLAGVSVGGPAALTARVTYAVLLQVSHRGGSANPLLQSLVGAGLAGALWVVLVVTLGLAGAAAAVIRSLIWRSGSGRRGDEPSPDSKAAAKPDPEPDPKPARKPTPKASKVLFALVAVVATIEAGGFAATYFLYSQYYVATSNAQVDADKQYINAPFAGMVTDWSVTEGSPIRANQVVGRIRRIGGGGQPGRTIRPRLAGVIASNNVTNGVYVAPGTTLAIAFDLSRIYVTARVDDNTARDVHNGAPVQIAADAYPDTPITGVVVSVGGSAASNFDIYPPMGTISTSNPQTAVNQYIPVKVALTGTAGARLIPGMNVTVHIRAR